MMKNVIFAQVIFFTIVAANGAIAACGAPSVQVVNASLTTLLSNGMVCKSNGSDWEWQEYHSPSAGFALIDYKKGASDPVDPSEQVGTWSTDEVNSIVTYDYGTGGAYTFLVYDNGGGSYDFCGTGSTSTVVSNAKIMSATGSAVSCGAP